MVSMVEKDDREMAEVKTGGRTMEFMIPFWWSALEARWTTLRPEEEKRRRVAVKNVMI
jgi:hypothetical protein